MRANSADLPCPFKASDHANPNDVGVAIPSIMNLIDAWDIDLQHTIFEVALFALRFQGCRVAGTDGLREQRRCGNSNGEGSLVIVEEVHDAVQRYAPTGGFMRA